MAPTRERQTKSTTKKRAPSPEPHPDLSQASSTAVADSQGADDINAMVEKALKEVIYPLRLSPFKIPVFFRKPLFENTSSTETLS
jgi:hypothetical protein